MDAADMQETADARLGDIGCRWPMWRDDERPTHVYCSAPRIAGRPYCGEHCRKAYGAMALAPKMPKAPRPPKSQVVCEDADPDAPPHRSGEPGRQFGRTLPPPSLTLCRNEAERELVRLYTDGMSLSDIARHKGTTKGVISGRFQRIRRRGGTGAA